MGEESWMGQKRHKISHELITPKLSDGYLRIHYTLLLTLVYVDNFIQYEFYKSLKERHTRI